MAESGMAPKKARAVAALLQSRTIGDAAAAAGVGERTLFRWLAEDATFTAQLRTAEGAAIDHAARRLVGLQDAAINVLSEVLADDAAPSGVRVRAASLIVELAIRLRELRGLEERITTLEAQATQWQSRR